MLINWKEDAVQIQESGYRDGTVIKSTAAGLENSVKTYIN